MQMKNVEDIYPLSPIQQGLLFHTLYAPESGIYCEQLGMTIGGPFNVAQFQRAWQTVVEHHPILRTAFLWEGLEEPLQVVREHVTLAWDERDWQSLPPSAQDAALTEFMATDRTRGFALNHAPLMRFTLVRVASDRVHFIWSYHHLLLDGTSTNMVLTQVFVAYDALQRGQTPDLPAHRPFKEYIAWLQEQNLEEAEAFWRAQLTGFPAPTPLMVDRLPGDPPAAPNAGPGEMELRLSQDATAALSQFARQQQLTVSTVVQGAWALLLSRYSQHDDVVFGITVSTRPSALPGAETMVGLFINSLPLRVRFPADGTVMPWLRAVQAAQVEARHYDFSPLVNVQGWSEVPPGQSLFESLLVFENYATDTTDQSPNDGLRIERTWWGAEEATYPLTLTVAQGPELLLRIGYTPARFSPATIGRLGGHLQSLIAGIVANPDGAIAQILMLTPAERQQVLVEWATSPGTNADAACLHVLFAAQAARTPGALAVLFGDQRLTYAELDARSNQIAHHLQSLGVGPDQLVGICLERSLDLIAGVLGILKAGGAYLPLDPAYPVERLTYMLADAGIAVVVSSQLQRDTLTAATATLETSPQVILLDADWPQIAGYPQSAPPDTARLDNLAYCIYTSGSTGRPKGVLVTHRGVGNLGREQIKAFGVTPESRVLQFASPSFDAAVSEVTTALLSGATLCLAEDRQLHSLPDLLALLRDQQISVVTLPPSLLAVLPAEDVPSLRTLVAAGEACQPEWLARWAAPGRRLIDAYGPTEATVCATLAQWDALGPLTIGRPIANVAVYVLDASLQPMPIGVPGELYIGGVGLARGYLNRPDLTADRFVAHPWQADARLYRTGDLARWLPDGQLQFVGRQDAQVKLRGYRIETEEIAAVLMEHPTVQAAAVILWEDGEAAQDDKQLVAYIVPVPGIALTTHDLFAFLQQRIPGYMIPATFVEIPALPLGPNGKLDRRALPSPFAGRMDATDTYIAPRNSVEAELAKIWAEVLGLDRVSVEENFFELGGHSLLATQVTSRIREVFAIELPVWTIFETLTIAELAKAIVQTGLQEADSAAISEAMQQLE